MPKKIDGQTYWTTEEFKANYLRGRTDAGATNPSAQYTESELKEAFEKGFKLNERLVSSAARAAYEDALQEGENIGITKGREEALKSQKEVMEEACKKAHKEGYQAGSQESKNEIQRLRNIHSYAEKRIGEEAVEKYKQEQRLSARAFRFFESIKPSESKVLLKMYNIPFTLGRMIGNIPVLISPFEIQIPNPEFIPELDISSFNYRYEQRHLLQFKHFKHAPFLVSFGVACIFVTGLKLKYEFNQGMDRHQRGEDKENFENRQKALQACAKLQKFNQEIQLPTEEKEPYAKLMAECQSVTQFFDSMKDVMATRRKLGIGDQSLFGNHEKFKLVGSIPQDIEQFEKRLADKLSRR